MKLFMFHFLKRIIFFHNLFKTYVLKPKLTSVLNILIQISPEKNGYVKSIFAQVVMICQRDYHNKKENEK